MTRFLSHHALGGLHSWCSPPTERSLSRLRAPAGGLIGKRSPGVLVSSPKILFFFANAIGGRRLPQPERAAQGGGWQGRREGGAEVGRRERGGGRQSSAAPSLVSAGWRWLRVPLRWCSPSQALRPPSLPLPSAEASRSPARRWACAR